jgi:hypothetical protein
MVAGERECVWDSALTHTVLADFLLSHPPFFEQYWDPPVQHLWGTYTNPIEAA